MSLRKAFKEIDSSGGIGGAPRTPTGDRVEHLLGELPEATTNTSHPQGIQVLVKNIIPDRRKQFERSQGFFAEFLNENENRSLYGGLCQLFLSEHQRGWRGVERQLKLLRPTSNCPTIRVKMQVLGSGDCVVCAAFFPEFQGTDTELYELLVAGNGHSSTWPNREPGHRPTSEEQASGVLQINLTKMRKRLGGSEEDVAELLEAIELYVGERSRRVTPEVLTAALEMALNVTMRNNADCMGVIRWLRDKGYLYRANGEAYFLPEREEPVVEAESEVQGDLARQDNDLLCPKTPTNVSETPPATDENVVAPTVDPLAELASFEQLAKEHKAHEALRNELVGRLNQLRTEEQATTLSIPRIEEQIAELQRNLDALKEALQANRSEQASLESQVSELEAEGMKYTKIAERIKRLAELFAS